ncbi:hypothetical protein LCGC14_1568750 [marine sediment metagenome]|uniref:Uncharacterized protein n=1 Tax=marine sediment metagenome TaxID=412755 RepID=A0A0F9J6L6_9ZZZZ
MERDSPSTEKTPDVPFSSNEVWLSSRQWLVAGVILAVVFCSTSSLWKRIEPFEPGPDYRIPYRLGHDYWMVNRYCGRVAPEDRTLLVGDSVVWGHYVSGDETLSHYLNELAAEDRYANLGVDVIRRLGGLPPASGVP